MINFRGVRTHATDAPMDDQSERVIMMETQKAYPVALLHAMPRAQMYDDVSHPSYAGVGQVRAIDGRNAYVMYVDDDTVEGYWLPRHELTIH